MLSPHLLCIPYEPYGGFGLLSAHNYTIQITKDCKTHAKQSYSFSMAPESLYLLHVFNVVNNIMYLN